MATDNIAFYTPQKKKVGSRPTHHALAHAKAPDAREQLEEALVLNMVVVVESVCVCVHVGVHFTRMVSCSGVRSGCCCLLTAIDVGRKPSQARRRRLAAGLLSVRVVWAHWFRVRQSTELTHSTLIDRSRSRSR